MENESFLDLFTEESTLIDFNNRDAYIPIVVTNKIDLALLKPVRMQLFFTLGLIAITYSSKRLNYTINNEGYEAGKAAKSAGALIETIREAIAGRKVIADRLSYVLAAITGYDDNKGLYKHVYNKQFVESFKGSILNPLFYSDRTCMNDNSVLKVHFDEFHLSVIAEQINITRGIFLWQFMVYAVRVGLTLYKLIKPTKTLRGVNIGKLIYLVLAIEDYTRLRSFN